MVREKIKFQGFINMATDVLVVFTSYVLAVYIRYEVMESQPGLNTLSTPYLLIALSYSVILSAVLSFTRKEEWIKPGAGWEYGLFSINAIGCLFLLAFLYTIGQLYFSRWALVLFWLISSVLLELKKALLTRAFHRRLRMRTGKVRVVVVGSGWNCNDYIRAVGFDNTCNFRVMGYLGRKSDIYFDYDFECGEGWLGDYDKAEAILKETGPDEVVFALEDEEYGLLEELLPITRKLGIRCSMVPGFGRYIPENAAVRSIDQVKVIDLWAGQDRKEAGNGIYGLGLTLSAVFLVLMLVIKRFGIGNVASFGMYEAYRCFIFAMAGYFLFFCVERLMGNRKYGNTAAALSTALAGTAAIVLYEMVYTQNGKLVQNVVSDLRMTIAVIAACWVAKTVADYIGKEDYSVMM